MPPISLDRHGHVVLRQHREVGELAGRERAAPALVMGEPGAALRVEAQRLLAARQSRRRRASPCRRRSCRRASIAARRTDCSDITRCASVPPPTVSPMLSAVLIGGVSRIDLVAALAQERLAAGNTSRSASASRRRAPSCARGSPAWHRSDARSTSAAARSAFPGSPARTRRAGDAPTCCCSSAASASCRAPPPISRPRRYCSFSASVGVSLLYMPQVTLSPMPLKRSMSSPKPIGSICVSGLEVLQLLAAALREQL